MSRPALQHSQFDRGLNVHIGDVAKRLMENAHDGKLNINVESGGWGIISEVLSFAANAEQKLADQRKRIADLECLTQIDPETEIGNHRAFEDCLRRTLASAHRHGERGVLAVIRLENLERITKVHGAAAAAMVARRIAKSLTVNIRPFDFAGRIAADKFAVLLVRSDPQGGIRRLKSLRASLDGMVLELNENTVKIALSLGTTVYNRASKAAQIIQMAEQSLDRDNGWRRRQFPALDR